MTGDTTKGQRPRAARYRRTLAKRKAVEPQRVSRFEARMARRADVRRRNRQSKRWCILRTSSRTTVALLDDLEAAGFDVWTPTQVTEKRMGRSRDRVECCTAMMPSFLFAAEHSAADLLRLSLDPTKRCTDFTVFHYRERVPFIADRDLAELRRMEDEASTARDDLRTAREAERERRRLADEAKSERERLAMLRNTAKPLPAGHPVRMPSGAWSGMTGIVVRSARGVTTVNLGGVIDVKIDTFLLDSDILEGSSA